MKVVIVMDGGIIQDVLAEEEGLEVVICDYDVEGLEKQDLSSIPQDDDEVADAYLFSDTVEVNKERVQEFHDIHQEHSRLP